MLATCLHKFYKADLTHYFRSSTVFGIHSILRPTVPPKRRTRPTRRMAAPQRTSSQAYGEATEALWGRRCTHPWSSGGEGDSVGSANRPVTADDVHKHTHTQMQAYRGRCRAAAAAVSGTQDCLLSASLRLGDRHRPSGRPLRGQNGRVGQTPPPVLCKQCSLVLRGGGRLEPRFLE